MTMVGESISIFGLGFSSQDIPESDKSADFRGGGPVISRKRPLHYRTYVYFLRFLQNSWKEICFTYTQSHMPEANDPVSSMALYEPAVAFDQRKTSPERSLGR